MGFRALYGSDFILGTVTVLAVISVSCRSLQHRLRSAFSERLLSAVLLVGRRWPAFKNQRVRGSFLSQLNVWLGIAPIAAAMARDQDQ